MTPLRNKTDLRMVLRFNPRVRTVWQSGFRHTVAPHLTQRIDRELVAGVMVGGSEDPVEVHLETLAGLLG